eukprot:2240909-Lingulodinium_polyedra.AAC.1
MDSDQEGGDDHWRRDVPDHGPRKDAIPEDTPVTFDGAAGIAASVLAERLPCAKRKRVFHSH